MKPVLVIGLGGEWMGDDGVGLRAAERLAKDSRLPRDVEVVCGGADLLRFADRAAGRREVLILDALEDASAEPGSVSVIEDLDGFDCRSPHAHALSAVDAIGVLRGVTGARIRLAAIAIRSAERGAGLSAPVSARLAEIVDRVLRMVS